MDAAVWSLPTDRAHQLASSAGSLTFVGGSGDFDLVGRIRRPDSMAAQIAGAMDNLAAALAIEGCTLDDVVRLKAFYKDDGRRDGLEVIADLLAPVLSDPPPPVTANPVPLMPFPEQQVQIQAIAQRGWRQLDDIRAVTRAVSPRNGKMFRHGRITVGLRAGEFIVIPGRTATEDGTTLAGDGIAQTHVVMAGLEGVLKELGASFQDVIKKEGYYFGSDLAQWADMAAIRASYFREPGAVATVVPCQDLWPPGTLTKVEVLALRERSNGFDKYVPRADSWPKRVWDWPIPVPYRQGIRMRDMIWTGGQVPFEPGRNAGRVVLAGRLIPQTRFTMGYIEDILGGFGAVMSDLRLLVCYFTSTGTMTETEQFLAAVADCVPGVLPPITLVPQPHMHNSEIMLEIWGVARG
jgi:enamine deaminase RidA (YjgF/YER057c/UK114 family)